MKQWCLTTLFTPESSAAIWRALETLSHCRSWYLWRAADRAKAGVVMRSTHGRWGLEFTLLHQSPWLPECKVKNRPPPFIRQTGSLARKDSRPLYSPNAFDSLTKSAQAPRLVVLTSSLASSRGTHRLQRAGGIRNGQRIESLQLIHNDAWSSADGAGVAIGLGCGCG